MARGRLIFSLVFLLTLPGFAGAEADDSLHFIGRYSFGWEGIPLAAAELSIDQDKDAYSLRLAVDSKGIVNLFTHHRSDTNAHGLRKDGKYLPQLYESHYWTKKKPRHLKLVFDAHGVITEETVEPPEDHTERPIVPHSLKDGTLDPLSMLLAVRAGNVAPRVFDAKHLYDGKAVRQVRVTLRTYAGPQLADPYVMSRKPVDGMTQKEMKEYNEGEPLLKFYFSGDDRRIPLYMSLPVSVGMLTGSLVQECKTWDECRIN